MKRTSRTPRAKLARYRIVECALRGKSALGRSFLDFLNAVHHHLPLLARSRHPAPMGSRIVHFLFLFLGIWGLQRYRTAGFAPRSNAQGGILWQTLRMLPQSLDQLDVLPIGLDRVDFAELHELLSLKRV